VGKFPHAQKMPQLQENHVAGPNDEKTKLCMEKKNGDRLGCQPQLRKCTGLSDDQLPGGWGDFCGEKLPGKKYGYGSIPIHTIFRGMNIHVNPAILMFTRGTIGFDTLPYFLWLLVFHLIYFNQMWEKDTTTQ